MKNMQLKNNNRPKITVFVLLLAACFLLVLSGCQNPLRPDSGSSDTAANEAAGTGDGPGSLSLTISRQGMRALMPPALMPLTIMPPETRLDDFDRFYLEFVAITAGNTSFSINWMHGSGTVYLEAGIWDLRVTSFLADAEGVATLKAAVGSKRIEVLAGSSIDGNVSLHPITEGEGTFSWDIHFPANVHTARMDITQINGAPFFHYYFQGGTPSIANRFSRILPAGRYRVIFTLINDREERAVASEILHVYRNMESGFEETFGEQHFITPLLGIILDAWDGSRWNFNERGITAGHFALLDIKGVTDSSFSAIISQFNNLSSPGVLYADANLGRLKTLVDAALIGIGRSSIAAGNHRHRSGAQAAITGFVENGTSLTFRWTNNRTVSVEIGAYEVEIVFGNDLHPGQAVSGNTLIEQLAWLRSYAQSGNHYLVEISGVQNISTVQAALSFVGRNNITITLRGIGPMPSTVNLSADGNLFTVDSGVTLVLDNNITLQGRTNNFSHLVRVNSGGTLVMNTGSMITGNRNFGTMEAAFGGGVRVDSGGVFFMYGGEISSNVGGGVYIAGGIFTMHNGSITENEGRRGSQVIGGAGGVHISGGTFTIRGGSITSNTGASAWNTGVGGVHVAGTPTIPGTFVMHDGHISDNTGGPNPNINGRYGSGGVHVASNGSFYMHGGEISGNRGIGGLQAGNRAGTGGVHIASGTFTMSGGGISGNTSVVGAGGVHIEGTSINMLGTFTMYRGRILLRPR